MLMQLRDYKQHSAVSSMVDVTSQKSKDHKGHVNGNEFSHADDSSSDEELKDPIEDCHPNLSDDDSCVLNMKVLTGHDTNHTGKCNLAAKVGNERRDLVDSEIPIHSTCPPNQFKNELMPVNAFNQENSSFCVRRSTVLKAKAMLSPEFDGKLEKNNNRFVKGGIVLHPNLKKLPYVSRGTRDRCHELDLKNTTTNSTGKGSLEENVSLTTSNFISSIQSSTTLEDKPTYNKRDDFFPTKTLHCESQSSLSSSSNASSVGSADLRSSTSSKELNGHSSTTSSSETQTDNEDVVLSKQTHAASPFNHALVSNSVFPAAAINSFQGASSLVHSTDQGVSTSKDLNVKQQGLSDNAQPKQLLALPNDSPRMHVTTQADTVTTITKPQTIKEDIEQENYNNSNNNAIGVNSISMIEHPTSKCLQTQTTSSSNGVKMRFPATSKQSKKNAASRNSLAFALQAKQTEESSSTDTDTIDLSRRPRSEMLDITRRMISSDTRRRAASLSPNSFTSGQLASCRKEISASLANLNSEDSFESNLNAVVESNSKDLSETPDSIFFRDENFVKSNDFTAVNNGSNSTYQSFYNSSVWSLSHGSLHNQRSRVQRKPSFQDRLKGAFSFQNIRKAISMEKLEEEERSSISYLNEFGEDVPHACSKRSYSSQQRKSSNPLRKASSITSIFNTVRMRKRKSRERRAAKLRNTIAIDPKQIPEFECISEVREQPCPPCNIDGEVGNPVHFRPIGRVLQMNVNQGTMLIEMTKPPSGPFGFYLARNKENGGVYISSMSDSYPDKMYSGLMKLGDEITEINGKGADKLSLDEIYNLILDNNRIILKIKPARVHSV